MHTLLDLTLLKEKIIYICNFWELFHYNNSEKIFLGFMFFFLLFAVIQ